MNVAGLGPKILTSTLSLVDNPNRATQLGNVIFIDLLGSGYSFASSLDVIPKTSRDYGVMITRAINSFVN
jgi:carboxypeptidase C (cathepsin A)